MSSPVRDRILVAALTVSLSGYGAWKVREGFSEEAIIPTKGDVPTLGHGSTKWEDGTPVKLGDRITKERADVLARTLLSQDEKRLAASLPGVKLRQEEFDEYVDFVGQYGIGNWRKSGMRQHLLVGNYFGACQALLKWRFAAKYDCSTTIGGRPNKRCWGVWERQQLRYTHCMEVQ